MMFSLREYREPSTRLADYLPWAALVAPGVVLQKGCVLQKTVSFRGPDLASSLDSELVSAIARLNNALRRLGSGWSLFVEAQRFESNDYPSSEWPCAAAWIFDLERRKHFEAEGCHFESAYYLTFAWLMPTDGANKLTQLFYDDQERDRAHDERASAERDVAQFQKTIGEILDITRGVFAEVHELTDEQTLTYLHSTISTHRHTVGVPDVPMYLDAMLSDMAVTSGDIPMLGDHFIPCCTIVGFPATTSPGLLDALNHLQIAYRWVTRFICLDKLEARGLLEKYRKHWFQRRKSLFTLFKEELAQQEATLIDNSAGNQAADADAALQELGDDLTSFGYLTTTLIVWDKDLDIARRKMQALKQVIQNRGFIVKDEALHATQAWLGSLPGHVYANVRRPIVSSINLAHMMPVSSVWAGERENLHLKQLTGTGAAHVYCSTTGDTPFRLNLNVEDVGHTLIIGPTGSGKSTLLGTLALQWLKYQGARVVIFDKDRSARAATLASQGICYEPGDDSAPLAFQPLRNIDQPAERIWASQFVLALLKAQGAPESPELKSAVDEALSTLAQQDEPQHRTLTVLANLLGSHRQELREAIRPYTLDGNFGQIFDADHEDFQARAWTMIEMGHLMAKGEEVVIPALEYLFHRVEQQFDGRPTLMIVDEAWLFLGHPTFAGRLQGWLKTLRKKNVYVVFATQEVADAAKKRDLLSTILSACHTKIFLPDEEALTPAMAQAYAEIGLTPVEIRLLAIAQKKRDYYYKSVRGRRMFHLNLGPAALAFVGMSGEDDHRFLDAMVRDLPAEHHAAAMLARRNVEWARHLAETSTGPYWS
jgi:type IV secretion/conjugal transfer VirB4 family ATPase